MPTIEVKDVTVEYVNKKRGNVVALNGFNALFPADCINVIVGYSGCGKSTLLKAVAGLLEYDGTILFDGEDADTVPVHKRNVGFVSQEYILYPNMTVFDNIAFPLKMTGAPREEIIGRVRELADKLDLTYCLTRKPKHLSGGQQQRVALARALVKNPSVCLMDEPLSNVDAQKRAEARVMIKKFFQNYGCTVLYVTHSLPEAMALGDTLTVIDEGKNIVSGTPLEVYRSGNETVDSLKEGATF